MNATIGRLFEILMKKPVPGDADIARMLDVNVDALRARLIDLRRRGILQGPFGEGETATWTSWFSTAATAMDAVNRSGLHAASPVILPRSWWNALRRQDA